MHYNILIITNVKILCNTCANVINMCTNEQIFLESSCGLLYMSVIITWHIMRQCESSHESYNPNLFHIMFVNMVLMSICSKKQAICYRLDTFVPVTPIVQQKNVHLVSGHQCLISFSHFVITEKISCDIMHNSS